MINPRNVAFKTSSNQNITRAETVKNFDKKLTIMTKSN